MIFVISADYDTDELNMEDLEIETVEFLVKVETTPV